MSLERSKELARAFYQAISVGGDLATLDEICVPDYQHRTAEPRSLEWLQERVRQFRLEDLLAEGDQVWARWTLLGTHLGPFEGIEPTGIQVEITNNFNLFRVADGRLVEDLVCWNNGYQLLLAQLRAASTPV